MENPKKMDDLGIHPLETECGSQTDPEDTTVDCRTTGTIEITRWPPRPQEALLFCHMLFENGAFVISDHAYMYT